jgi:pimeloyl-ACP methyl ester carboxylesterase
MSGERPVLLLHAGIADSRMWSPQLDLLGSAGFRVVAPDLRGFGERALDGSRFSHAQDAAALLDGPALVVGSSLGGRVALELALRRPELVDRLVLIAPGMPGWDWSPHVRDGWEAEEAAFERGDRDGAAEASLRLWIDGPRRSPEAVDPGLRALVREMVLRSYELQADAPEDDEEELPGGPLRERLGEIGVPTLVLVGDEDVPDMQAIAAHVAASIGGARLVTLSGVSHLPSLERPGEVNELLLEFFS